MQSKLQNELPKQFDESLRLDNQPQYVVDFSQTKSLNELFDEEESKLTGEYK